MERRKAFRTCVLLVTIALYAWFLVPCDAIADNEEVQQQISIGRFFAYRGYQNQQELTTKLQTLRSELEGEWGMSEWRTFWHAEHEFLIFLDSLKYLPQDQIELDGLQAKLLQLYAHLLDSFYELDQTEAGSSNLPSYLEYVVRDAVLASATLKGMNSTSPMLRCLLRRADEKSLYNPNESFLGSVKDMLDLEYPNAYGISNLVCAVWVDGELSKLEEGSAEEEIFRKACRDYAGAAADTLKQDYSLSIAYYLLAKRYSADEKDLAWTYFTKAIDLSSDSSAITGNFYRQYFYKDRFATDAVTFLTDYFEYLFDEGRYTEILNKARLLLGCKTGDRKIQERIVREAILWGEKSIRAADDSRNFALSKELLEGLNHFRELHDPNL